LEDATLHVLGWLHERNKAALKAGFKPHMEKPEEGRVERRGRGDRRSRSRLGALFFLLGGRRQSARRESDKKEFFYVDQYRPWLLVAIILLVILSLADGLFTLHLVKRVNRH